MSGTLWVVAFDLDRLALRGEPVRVSETLQVDMLSAANLPCRGPVRSPTCRPARRRGRLCGSIGQGARRQSTRCRHARTKPLDCLPTVRAWPSRSKIGSLIFGPGILREKSLTRLTFGPSLDFLPRWTPDGRRIVFRSDRDGPPNLYSVASDGSGPVERLTTSDNDQYPNSITPDGTALLFASCGRRPDSTSSGFPVAALRAPAATAVR